MPRTTKTISVTIRIEPGPDQHAWLKQHPEINASGLLQRAIDRKIARAAAE